MMLQYGISVLFIHEMEVLQILVLLQIKNMKHC
jgi:hypothetical protein